MVSRAAGPCGGGPYRVPGGPFIGTGPGAFGPAAKGGGGGGGPGAPGGGGGGGPGAPGGGPGGPCAPVVGKGRIVCPPFAAPMLFFTARAFAVRASMVVTWRDWA